VTWNYSKNKYEGKFFSLCEAVFPTVLELCPDIAKIDALLLRPAEELDHARALEVAMVYYQPLDRLLNAAMARRNAILDDIERYDYLFYAPLALSAVIEEVHELGNGHANESQGAHAQFGEAAPALARSHGGQS
jgi:hypothetical protein